MDRRVLVYGAGVIGSVYAVRLALAGCDVTVKARGPRLESIRAGGLRIRHASLGEEEGAEVRCIEDLDRARGYDLVLVTVRAGQIMGALEDLARVEKPTAVVVIGNNVTGHAAQAALVGAKRFVLGFGAFGGYREDDETVVYLDGRSPEKPSAEHRSVTTLGVLAEDGEPALAVATHDLEESGLPTRVSTDMVAWLQCHAALVFPLGGAIYAAAGEQERICRTRDALVLGVRACRELFGALRKLGVPLEPRSLKTLLRTPEPLLVRTLRGVLAGESARVTMFGHAKAARGRDEIGTQAQVLDGIVRTSGLPLPNWERLLPYFDRPGSIDPIPDGSRRMRLRIW